MMGCEYTNKIGSFFGHVGELRSAFGLHAGDTHSSHPVGSHGLAVACDVESSPKSIMTNVTGSLHLAISPNSVATSVAHTPHPTSPAATLSDSIESPCDVGSPLFEMNRRAVMQKNMPIIAAKLNAQVGKHLMCSLAYTNDRIFNANDLSSDMKPPFRKPKSRADRLSSPASECSHLDVTRAGSECSFGDGDEDGLGMWCEEDIRLVAEVLAAKGSLLEVQNELDLRISSAELLKLDKAVQMRQSAHFNTLDSKYEKHSCGLSCHGIHKDQAKGKLQDSFEGTEDLLCSNTDFYREHLQRLRDTPSERRPQEDPTLALQGSLQDLLLVARVSDLVQEQEKVVLASSQLESQNLRGDSDWYEDGATEMLGSKSMKNLLGGKRRVTEASALRKEPSLMSWERAKVKEGHASQKRDTCFRRQTQQTVAEEMYCKETIQRLVHQMQAEMEQWSQMQDILYKLQEELDGMNDTQRLWEERAHQADAQVVSLQEELHDWKSRAQSSQEELVMLRCEKQVLKNRIEMMEDAQMCMSGVIPRLEAKSRCANVGTQHEEFAACESFVHSRNESGRSSVDLGTSSQRSFRKSIKKSMSFANNKENINTTKFRFGNFGVPTRAEPIGIELFPKKADMGSKGKPKNQTPLAHFVNVNTVKLDSSEHLNGQERKKARLFAFRDKLTSASNVSNSPFNPKNVNRGLQVGPADSATQDRTDTLWSLKPKSSLPCAPTSTPLPSAPTSTPSRVPFGNIVNITKH